MARYLGKRDIEPHQPLVLYDGEQVRVEHIGCPAGKDGRRRLALKRDGRDYLLYCHHCGLSGKVSNAVGRSLRRAPAQSTTEFDPYAAKGWVYDRSEWPPEAFEWLIPAKLTDSEMVDIGYCPKTGRIALPVFEGEDLVGYTLRALGPSRAKYLSAFKPGRDPYALFPRQGGRSTKLVIVEDWMSAKKASRVADSLALMGTKMPDGALVEVAKRGYTHALVYLDNDNPTVRRLQHEVARAAGLFVPFVSIVRQSEKQDPKLASTTELEEVISTHIK